MSSESPTRDGPDAGAYFDDRAHRYDRTYDEPRGYAVRSRMAAVLALIGDGPGSVVDAGMGGGRLLEELARREWSISGVDASAEMVSAARMRLPEHAGRLVHGRIESLPFKDAAFDAVVATGVLEYADVPTSLAELHRVLRPRGRAVLSYPNPGNFYWFWRDNVWYPAVSVVKRLLRQPPLVFPPASPKADPSAFRRLLEAAGLRPQRVRYTSFLVFPSPLDAIAPRTAQRLGLILERYQPSFAARFAGQVVYSAEKMARQTNTHVPSA